MCKLYGYCRISTRQQSIDRQIRNIKAVYPDAFIFEEAYTGTQIVGRKEFNKLLKIVNTGDTIVFDSVSRMSRDAEDGVRLYMELLDKGIELVFLKENYINTEVYKRQLVDKVQLTGTNVDEILKGINNYFRTLAADQIRIAFEQSQKEVDDLKQRTKEGLVTARANGKQIGLVMGTKLTTKKSIAAKEKIKKNNKAFGGSLNDKDTITLCSIDKNTFYRYKKQLIEELQAEQNNT